MSCKQRISLLAIVLSCSLESANAQNNLNNLNNIEAVNGANSINEINENTGNNTNNVLDSEELNSNNASLNATGDNFNNSDNINGNTLNNSNLSNNNSLGENNELNNSENNSEDNEFNSESNANLENEEPENSTANTGADFGNAQAQGNTLDNTTSATGNLSASGSGSAEPFPDNPVESFEPFPGDAVNTSSQFSNSEPFPQNTDAPPPVDQGGGVISEIPAPESNAENSAQAALAQKAQEREEKRRQKLELARQMAEAIPALNPGEAPPEYVVQPGDTLWDISDQLLDDAMWWPKLWVLNPDIQDPDEIEPGMTLLFYPSAGGEAPALVVQDRSDIFGAPKIDPTTLQTFSMRANRWIGKNGELVNAADLPGDQNLLTGGDMGATASYTVHLPGFMTNQEIDTAGEVVTNSNFPLIAGRGQNIVARFRSGAPNPGERFVAIRHRPVFNSLSDTGAQTELYNYVGVLGVVKNTSDGYTVLVPVENMAYISPTDLLIPFSKSLVVAIDPNAGGRPNPAPARVLATQDGTYSYAGPGMAVFLQGNDGRNPYSVGDDVELFMPLGSGLFVDEGFVSREKAATARVIETNQDTAVAIIIQSNREVSSGALTYPAEN